MHIPLTFQLLTKKHFFLKTSFNLLSIPTNQAQHILFNNNNKSCSSTTFSHISSITIAPTPPTPSPSQDHHIVYLLPYIHSILENCSLHFTSCKQHTSIIHFLSSSKYSPPFHADYLNRTPKRSSSLPSCCEQYLQALGCRVAPSVLWLAGAAHPNLRAGRRPQ